MTLPPKSERKDIFFAFVQTDGKTWWSGSRGDFPTYVVYKDGAKSWVSKPVAFEAVKNPELALPKVAYGIPEARTNN